LLRASDAGADAPSKQKRTRLVAALAGWRENSTHQAHDLVGVLTCKLAVNARGDADCLHGDSGGAAMRCASRAKEIDEIRGRDQRDGGGGWWRKSSSQRFGGKQRCSQVRDNATRRIPAEATLVVVVVVLLPRRRSLLVRPLPCAAAAASRRRRCCCCSCCSQRLVLSPPVPPACPPPLPPRVLTRQVASRVAGATTPDNRPRSRSCVSLPSLACTDDMAESDAGAAALVDAESTTFTETTAPLSALDSSSTSVPAASEVRAAA